jgi:DNA-binding NarL/FixJ family response regulator
MVCTEASRTSLVRVLLADDDRLYAEALEATLLGHDWIEVVGTASDGAEAVELVRALRPDVVLMDGLMPGMDGYEATRRLADAGCAVRVLIVTSSREPADATRACGAGAAALYRKGEFEETIADEIRASLPPRRGAR